MEMFMPITGMSVGAFVISNLIADALIVKLKASNNEGM